MTTKEMIEVLSAYEAGKKIQYRDVFGFTKWQDVGWNAPFNFADYEYRIKPEPREFYIHYCNKGEAPKVYFPCGLRRECDGESIRVREVLE